MRVAVIFANLGPYHVARLQALAGLCALTVIELHEASLEYDWLPASEVPFERITISAQRDSSRATALKLERVLEQARPDVLLVPGWSGSAAIRALSWSVRRGVPAILMSDSQAIDFARSGWKEAIKGWIVRRYAGALVAGTPHRAYVEALGMGAAVRPGYDVVDNDFFAAGAAAARSQRERLRASYGLPERYLLSTARFIDKKNVAGLLDAFALYRDAAAPGEAWDLVVLGEGPLRGALEAKVAALGLGGAVHLPGFRQYADLPAYYGLAQAFVLASVSEQWGLVVNEAMASGLPVLVSDRCGCSADLVEEGVNGFVFSPGDGAGLAALMTRLTRSSPQALDRMGEASHARIAQWSPGLFAANVLALGQQVLRGPRAKAALPVRLALGLFAHARARLEDRLSPPSPAAERAQARRSLA